MTDTYLDITAGLPYNRRIRIVDGKNTWGTLNTLEVRSQVRVSEDPTSTLKCSLSSFFDASYDGNDIVLDLTMTGKDTRGLSGGFYDVVVSDTGITDTRAIRVLRGQLRLTNMVTAGS